MEHTPLKQRPAREQQAAGVSIPYWHEDLDVPVTYHRKLLLLTPEELDCLVLYYRKHAAEVSPNPNDNRNGRLDYPATNRERVDVLRHICFNRTERNSGTLAGYRGGFDNLLHCILQKGVDVEARQLELRRQVLTMIAQHYPHLKEEAKYQMWLAESGLKNRRAGQ